MIITNDGGKRYYVTATIYGSVYAALVYVIVSAWDIVDRVPTILILIMFGVPIFLIVTLMIQMGLSHRVYVIEEHVTVEVVHTSQQQPVRQTTTDAITIPRRHVALAATIVLALAATLAAWFWYKRSSRNSADQDK